MEQKTQFSTAELVRYNRQIMIDGIGEMGQLKLKRARVTVVGGGGLGCPVSLYLVAGGVGHVMIIDDGDVELSNLNRQVLHWNNDIGRPKVLSIVEKLRKMNPEVAIEPLQKTITKDNVRSAIKDSGVVVDALDNWRTRFLLNKACVAENKPLVHAGVFALYGQITTIIPGKGPCLQCIMPKAPPQEKKIPVLGATAGILGLLEASEAMKIILGLGEPLVGRLIHVDSETMSFQEIRFKRNMNCPVCGSL